MTEQQQRSMKMNEGERLTLKAVLDDGTEVEVMVEFVGGSYGGWVKTDVRSYRFDGTTLTGSSQTSVCAFTDISQHISGHNARDVSLFKDGKVRRVHYDLSTDRPRKV
jgi:hypothetical protein